MKENQSCESALIDVCEEFLEFLGDMLHRGIISEAEYKTHSFLKIKFLREFKKGTK